MSRDTIDPIQADRKPVWQFAAALVVLAAAAILVWTLSYVLLLVFAAIIIASIIRGLSNLICHYTPLGNGPSIAAALVTITVVVAGSIFLMGQQISEQFSELVERVPELLETAGETLGIDSLPDQIVEVLPQVIEPGALAGRIGAGVTGILGIVTWTVVVVVAGVYLAVSPHQYQRGVLLLVPRKYRGKTEAAFASMSKALQLWLAGQLAAMVFIGVATTAAMMALGLPSAIAIGLIAGILEFIPFLGPILAAIPALLVALGEGEEMFLWVLIVYVLIQQFEGNVLVPLIQKRAVHLPPALGLFAVLVFAILFGPLGILLATPLTVVAMVAVQKVYVQGTLHEPIKDGTQH